MSSHSRRTSPPTSSENHFGNRPPNAGDWINDAITDLRNGDDSDFVDDDDELEEEQEKQALETLHAASESAPAPALPPVLQRIFGSDAEEELMAVARLLDPSAKKSLTLVFHTPVGDVKCPVNWSSTAPEHLDKTEDLLLIMVRSKEGNFAPHPGSELEISFIHGQGHRSPRLKVMSLARPMQLYPSVGIDLLCFLPQTDGVEKNGRVAEGAPSVVSGKPSDHVDEDTGEPVAEGEKSASMKLPAQSSPPRGASAPSLVVDDVPVEDFDNPREP